MRMADRVLDEDYALVLVHPAPATMPRARWLEVLEDYIVHSYSVLEQSVARPDGLAAVLGSTRGCPQATRTQRPSSTCW